MKLPMTVEITNIGASRVHVALHCTCDRCTPDICVQIDWDCPLVFAPFGFALSIPLMDLPAG